VPVVGFETFPVQTNPLPLTTPLFWISGKGQVKELEEDCTLTAPRTSLMAGREALLNDPVQSMEPPTVATLGKPLMIFRELSLATRKVPSIMVSAGNDRLDNVEQLTNDKEEPTRVRFGALIEAIELEKKPRLLETFWRAGKSMDAMLRNDAFWADKRTGKETVI